MGTVRTSGLTFSLRTKLQPNLHFESSQTGDLGVAQRGENWRGMRPCRNRKARKHKRLGTRIASPQSAF